MAKKTKTEEVVLSVNHVSKNFHLPHEKNNSIKSAIVNIFKSKDTEVDVQHALKDISFEIKKGEFFGILGRNGSGKSTLLKILAEIYQPTTGSVNHNGKLVPFIELGVGFNPELTGRENVYLNGALLGFSRKEIDARYDDIVKFAELEEFMDQKLKNYSSGMQVRLAFSVATRAEADILLVDEVLAVGDADFQRKCYDFFKSLKKSKMTVIFVTHDMGAVREYCDRAILINEGIISHQGKAEKIADEYLKLFNEAEGSREEDSVDDEKAPRWGTGSVKIKDVELDTRTKEGFVKVAFGVMSHSNQSLDVQVVYKFSDEYGNVVAGTSLASLTGKARSVVKLDQGESKRIEVDFVDIFPSGKTSVSLTLQSPDGVTMYDVWNDVATIHHSGLKRYYPIYPRGIVKEGKL
jgi:ABC-2 type transport system ATP-binding protein